MRADTDKLPGNVLTINLKKIWEVIKDQKDLNLPAHKVHLLWQQVPGLNSCRELHLWRCSNPSLP